MKSNKLMLLAGTILIISLSLLVGQHWGMMLSNSDDPWIVSSSWAMRLQTASEQGRFWLIPINTLAALPYQLGSWDAANVIKIVVNAAVFISFVSFCIQLTGVGSGLLTGLVWLALIDVSPGYYSPFHGFLLMFNLQFAVLFCSFLYYLQKIRKPPEESVVIFPYLLFAFSLLAYEPMLFYAGVYPAIYLHHNFTTQDKKPSIARLIDLSGKFCKYNWPLFFVVFLYILTYFTYRHFQPNPGRGIDSNGNIFEIAKTIYKFSVNGFHLNIKPLGSYIDGTSSSRTLYLASSYGILVFLGFFLLVPKIQSKRSLDLLFSKFGLTTLAFYVFCPNLLHGFVDAYRRWAADDPHYVGNYFSSFPLAILISLAILSQVGGRKATQEKILFAMIAIILATSACDNYVRWADLAERNRLDSQLWFTAIEDLRHETHDAAKRTTVCGLNAPEKVSGDERYWSKYLTEITAKPIQYNYKNLAKIQCDITIDFNKYRFTKKTTE